MPLLDQLEPTAPVGPLSPEEQEAVRKAQVSAYTGPSVEAETVALPSESVPVPTTPESSPYITPEATVQSQLQQILAAGSPLQDLAESRAEEEAQRRGLLSSSMAIGAGQKALYDTALEVAKPDAATFAKANLQELAAQGQLVQTGFEGDITGALKAAQGQIDYSRAAQQGQIQLELQRDAARDALLAQTQSETVQQAMQQLDIDSAERRDAAKILSTEYMQSEDLAAERANVLSDLANRLQISQEESASRLEGTMADILARVDIANAEIAMKAAQAAATVDAQQRGDFIGAVEELTKNFNNSYMNLQGLDMTATEKAAVARQMIAEYENQMNAMAQIYDQEVSWTPGEFQSVMGGGTNPLFTGGGTGGTTGGTGGTTGGTQPTFPGVANALADTLTGTDTTTGGTPVDFGAPTGQYYNPQIGYLDPVQAEQYKQSYDKAMAELMAGQDAWEHPYNEQTHIYAHPSGMTELEYIRSGQAGAVSPTEARQQFQQESVAVPISDAGFQLNTVYG